MTARTYTLLGQPMLRIYNHHTAACDTPPALSHEAADLHLGYLSP